MAGDNVSVLGRLVEEISWEGSSVRRYRDGGRGVENILTAEVLSALDFLPRQAFLGAVLDGAHGADATRRLLSDQVEDATLSFLPDEIVLNPAQRSRGAQLIVQPDASLETASCYALVEAKRIRHSSFQPQQLAREYLAVTRRAETRAPLLLVVHGLASAHPASLDELTARISEVCAWTTWNELAAVVAEQQNRLTVADPSIAASIDRLVKSIVRSVAWHA